MFYYPLSFPIVLTDLLLLSGREATRQTQQFSHFPGSFLQWCAEYPTVVFAWNLLVYNFSFYRSLFRSLSIFPFFILLPCSQTVELAEYHHQYIKHPTKVYILNLLMLFNEERSHLAADQSKNFPQSLTYNYYWIPRLVIVVIWPKCCAAFFLLLFFFFFRVQLFNKRSEALMENASSIPPKSPSGIPLTSSWYGMLSQTSEREREKKRCGLETVVEKLE